MIHRMPLTFHYKLDTPIGNISVGAEIERMLVEGKELILSPSTIDGKVVGLTLLTMEAARVRSIYD